MHKIRQMCLTICQLFVIYSIIPCEKSHAGVLWASIPKGKEIADSYLEQLFAPEYPYEWVKVVDTEEGKRFVLIKAKQKITEEMEKHYQEKTLRERNISIYRHFNPHTGRLGIARIRLTRKLSDKPYVIEYCQADPSEIGKKEKDIAWRDGEYFILWIDKNFGKKYKRLVIYPEKEESCPDAPQVGKYPNAKTLGCSEQAIYPLEKGRKRIVFTYVTKDDPQRVYDFYKDKILANFQKMNINYPENYWKVSGESNRLGIQIVYEGIDIIDKILNGIRGKASIPSQGVVFHIMVFKGVYAEHLIKDYSWIRIYYEIEPEIIKERIKEHSKEMAK